MTPPQFERQNDSPLYPKVLWNRPVSRSGAGRILLPGGFRQDFSMLTAVHQAVTAAGAGECIAALPDVLVKLLGGAPSTTFVHSSPSGSLGRQALARLLELSEDADSVMLGANLSANSDTTLLLERFLQECSRPVIGFGDVLASLQHRLPALIQRPGGLLIVTMPDVFKLAGALGISINIRRDGGLINKLEIIQQVAAAGMCDMAVYGSEIIISVGEQLGVTPLAYRLSELPALFYGTLASFWTQNPAARYAGLMTGAHVLRQVSEPLTKDPQHRVTVTDGTKAIRQFLDSAF